MIELERDLRIVLSEYAPGSEVVAAGKLWTSRYIVAPVNNGIRMIMPFSIATIFILNG